MAEFTPSGPHDGRYTLAVTGDLDIASVEGFLGEARACLAAATPRVDIDFAAVTFIDSSGLGALVQLHNEAAAAGQVLELLHVPRSVARVLTITGLDELFPEVNR